LWSRAASKRWTSTYLFLATGVRVVVASEANDWSLVPDKKEEEEEEEVE
jgi:hypothetical protein